MATSRGKGNRGQRQPGRQRGGGSGQRITEEIVLLQGVDTQNPSRQSYLALQKAFNDVTKKLRYTQEEKSKLQAENVALQTTLEALYEENENLKKQLEMGFKAFDDKFKETVKLKEKLNLREEQSTAEKEDKSNDDQSTASVTLPEIDIPIALQEAQEISRSTQTDEEKTDEVPLSSYRNLLQKCGLEIVTQGSTRAFLILVNRDNFQLWLENEANGTLKVQFEKESVTERFVQTDEIVSQQIQTCNHEGMIITLKSKITDQGNVIKKQRQLMAQMYQNQLPEAAQKENKGTKDYQYLKRYHQVLLQHCQKITNEMILLKEQLENQQKYTKRLVDIIKGSKDLPKQFMLISEVTHEKLKIQGQREVKQPPSFSVTEEHIEDDIEEISNEEENNEDNSNLYSIAVQETDGSLTKLSSAGNGSSASVVTLSESKSSGLPSSRGLGDSNQKNSFGEKEEAKPVSVIRSIRDENAGITDRQENMEENDDIEIINEDPAITGGAAGVSVGAKQCPVCYISFAPSFSQDEFEAHVLAHFRDD